MVIERLPIVHKVLGLIPSTAREKENTESENKFVTQQDPSATQHSARLGLLSHQSSEQLEGPQRAGLRTCSDRAGIGTGATNTHGEESQKSKQSGPVRAQHLSALSDNRKSRPTWFFYTATVQGRYGHSRPEVTGSLDGHSLSPARQSRRHVSCRKQKPQGR